jgi:hypothetical protein
MSARRRAFHLSREALRDVDNVLLYTRRMWGKAQQAMYRAVIYQALEMITAHP